MSAVRGAKKIEKYQRAHTRSSGRTRSSSAVSRKGASKKKSGNTSLWARIRWGLLLKLATITAAIYIAVWQVNWQSLQARVDAAVNKPVSSIAVEGEFRFLSQKEIRDLVLKHIDGNFADINLVSLQDSLKANPWVKTANVKRVWPDGLQITVFEQKPIARWGDSGVINNEGLYLSTGDNSQLAHLPLLYGPDNQKKQITRTYLDMTEMLASRKLTLAGVHVDDTLSWRVVLDNGMELVFGQYQVLTKLRNFILVFDQKLRAVSDQVVTVDMRYDSGMAVSWRAQAQEDLQVSR